MVAYIIYKEFVYYEQVTKRKCNKLTALCVHYCPPLTVFPIETKKEIQPWIELQPSFKFGQGSLKSEILNVAHRKEMAQPHPVILQLTLHPLSSILLPPSLSLACGTSALEPLLMLVFPPGSLFALFSPSSLRFTLRHPPLPKSDSTFSE